MALVRRETHYEILGVDRQASESTIKKQFVELHSFWESFAVKSPHESELKLVEIQNAFSILSDPNLKQSYDETLDFEFVLLDGKTKDADIEEAYEIYRQNQPKTYQEILQDFQKFKIDLGSTLWLLKSTTLYLIFSLFAYSGIVLLFSIIDERYETLNHENLKHMKNFLVPVYLVFAFVGYLVFKKYVQLPLLKKRNEELKPN